MFSSSIFSFTFPMSTLSGLMSCEMCCDVKKTQEEVSRGRSCTRLETICQRVQAPGWGWGWMGELLCGRENSPKRTQQLRVSVTWVWRAQESKSCFQVQENARVPVPGFCFFAFLFLCCWFFAIWDRKVIDFPLVETLPESTVRHYSEVFWCYWHFSRAVNISFVRAMSNEYSWVNSEGHKDTHHTHTHISVDI